MKLLSAPLGHCSLYGVSYGMHQTLWIIFSSFLYKLEVYLLTLAVSLMFL